MPKIEITNAKGLVQVTGSGIDVQSPGTKSVVKKRFTIPADGTTPSLDQAVTLPAGAVITDVFAISHAALQTNAAGGSALTVGVGTDDPATDIVAATNVLANGDTTSADEAAILTAGTKLDAASGVALAFATGAVLHSTTARSINLTVTVVGAAMATGGDLTVGLEYTIL